MRFAEQTGIDALACDFDAPASDFEPRTSTLSPLYEARGMRTGLEVGSARLNEAAQPTVPMLLEVDHAPVLLDRGVVFARPMEPLGGSSTGPGLK